MALKLKYTDEYGILHINMSPSSTPTLPPSQNEDTDKQTDAQTDITDPKFDTINNRFSQYDLFGGKYDVDSGGETDMSEKRSLFRSRYNSIQEELANTPYAFATERSLRLNANSPILDITIARATATDASPSKDIEDDRFFNRSYDLFGPEINFQTSIKTSDEEETPAFTVTQLIHAQDRYFDLSTRKSDSTKTDSVTVKSLKSAPNSGVKRTVSLVTSDEAFKVLGDDRDGVKSKKEAVKLPVLPAVPTPTKKKKESSFAILAGAPVSRPSSPRSLPLETKAGRVSAFKGRGFKEETSRHTIPKTSAANSRVNSRNNSRNNSRANSRANSPPRRRTNSLSKLDKMATATLPPPIPPIHNLSRPHSPRNFVKENIEEIRELSELNREKHEAEAEKKIKEEEEALLKEMAEFEGKTTEAIRSVVCSRTTSRSNSPNKLMLRSRSNSPATAVSPAALHYENLSSGSSEYINTDDGMSYPVTHKSRIRFASQSQPQSNDGSPKHSKIPTRQNSVSPSRKRDSSSSRRVENNLNKSQRFISNSTSNISETTRIGNQVQAKKGMSKSTQLLHISPAHIKGKPPIPGKIGPPPSNRYINSKRLSPIVGTPSKTPSDESKPNSARTPTKPSPVTKKPVKTAGNTPATSRFNSRQPSRNVSRDPSPDKRKALGRTSITSKTTTNTNTRSKPVARSVSTRVTQKPSTNNKTEAKKPINRTNSMKTLSRTPSVKTLNEKPPLLKKRDSTRDLSLRATSSTKINETGTKKDSGTTSKKDDAKSPKKVDKSKDMPDKDTRKNEKESKKAAEKSITATSETGTLNNAGDSVMKQDNETQYDTVTNEKGELVILTKKNVVSMTTAAITSQPLEVVTKVTNQLPVVLEKAREKAMFERLSSRESLAPKDEIKSENEGGDSRKGLSKIEAPKQEDSKQKTTEEKKSDSKTKLGMTETEKETKDVGKIEEDKDPKVVTKPPRSHEIKSTIFADDNVKLKPLLPPYNNPQVARVKQKIDEILNSPEVATENILQTANEASKAKETKNTFKSVADKTKSDIKEAKDEAAAKLTNIKEEALQAEKDIEKAAEKTSEDIRTEATKIVDSILTPVEEPKHEKPAEEKEPKKTIEPIIMVVNEKKNTPMEIVEKMTETLVKGEPEVEVQSSNMSTPKIDRMEVQNKIAEGSDSDKSQSNGGFPQSTSTTPKPPARTKRDQSKDLPSPDATKENTPDPQKRPNICHRLMDKCKKCCPCCTKAEDDEEKATQDVEMAKEEKRGVMSKLNCFKKKKDGESEVEKVDRKNTSTSVQYESETKQKRKFRDVLCACCARQRRVSDSSQMRARSLSPDASEPSVVTQTGCCGGKRKEVERRDSILSDPPSNICCNNRLFNWFRGKCGRQPPEELSASRRQSLYSKNKSLSPTLPPEDTRTKLDTTLVEHTSLMRGAIPVLPISLAIICLACNVVVPGLGTILSGMFCLCFGIPRFGVHDGVKHRIGSFLINLVVGCGQLFTVLFCLVGWGWSIWWGVIMVKIARKYRRLKAEEASQDAESAAPPPVTANNHTTT